VIALATCVAWPALSASDQCLAEALHRRGHDTVAAPWNGSPAPFAAAAATVLRSTWDYHDTPDAYLRWLETLDPRRTFNAPALVRWNVPKTYILDLAERGAPAPRTVAVPADAGAVAAALQALGVDDAVMKPLVGASGFGVERVSRGAEADALARAGERKRLDRVLVQEFLGDIADGELAGVFFEGVFSHGLRRVPAAGEFRINTRYGGRMLAADLAAPVVEEMTAVLELLPERPLYARIDGLLRGGREFVLMEVEVNEPGLGLDLAPGSADRFADALLRRLSG
jgi:glutathione synthase/RimK-type ligase-like ATP-grasp enzyme